MRSLQCHVQWIIVCVVMVIKTVINTMRFPCNIIVFVFIDQSVAHFLAQPHSRAALNQVYSFLQPLLEVALQEFSIGFVDEHTPPHICSASISTHLEVQAWEQ